MDIRRLKSFIVIVDSGSITRAADLLIETEIEMRKVTWPTTREVTGATVVVLVVVLLLGLYLWFLDMTFQYTFLKWLGLTARTATGT